MDLNLENEETLRLAQEISRLTGETLATAVVVARRERLDRLRQKENDNLSERLLSTGQECARHLREPILSIEHGKLLYQENGLPK